MYYDRAVSEHYVHKEKSAEFGADFREDMPLSPLKKKMSTFNSGTSFELLSVRRNNICVGREK